MHRKAISLFFGAATIAGTVAMGGAAEAATPNSAAADVMHHVVWQSGKVSPMHVPNHGFNTYSFNGVSWRATVTVDYGRTGAWTHCSDGTDIHGPLQGPGFWDFGGSCSGHGTITQYGWYDG
ncbi:hypothetical protein ACFWBS_20255 [Streptomyces mirabilis]|uniref:hypothetical protein n=1 Tax=Streptomyces mirabilis TaxID=68239 RepID=UPI0036516B42